MADSYKHATPSHVTEGRVSAEFVRSMPNGNERNYGDPPEIFDFSRPVIQGHSRSLEPTRIDRLPMTSCE